MKHTKEYSKKSVRMVDRKIEDNANNPIIIQKVSDVEPEGFFMSTAHVESHHPVRVEQGKSGGFLGKFECLLPP